ncbi:hypothetical protein [Polycladidibacter stylochi]|uniref:hypothetical protein n=1 Tax=Polycladidibacter stylochi TaxID=1807766 RepID=UPI0008335069|nr:hypothetical protein [Pseudovibrio stylochi]
MTLGFFLAAKSGGLQVAQAIHGIAHIALAYSNMSLVLSDFTEFEQRKTKTKHFAQIHRRKQKNFIAELK